MKYVSTLLAVRDMERSKAFYHDVLGLLVESDFGANVTMTGGLALQALSSWHTFINKEEDEISFGACSSEIYFEEPDIETFMEKLAKMPEVQLIHPLKEHRWGQRAVRFYDPDLHIIEVAEPLESVVWRFHDAGMSDDEIADRMDVFVFYVRSVLRTKQS